MLTLIRNAEVIAPEPLGSRDILLAGERIAAIEEPGAIHVTGTDVEELDVDGAWVLPGLVDSHVHILGGGGEGGPATRAPEILVESIVGSGVTTVIGCLGTDGVTRHLSSLVAKARGLRTEGISAFVFVGSYELPVESLTGSVRSDLILVQEIIGAGEIAISDHRSSQPTFEDLCRLAAECRVGGLLGGKAGVLHLHLGDGARGLDMVFRMVKETEIPSSQLIPTHCNRNAGLFDQAVRFALEGGHIDLTSGLEGHPSGLSVEAAIGLALERGAPIANISVSSDANGSLPVFDDSGALTYLGVASQSTLLTSLRALVENGTLDLHDACRPFTENPSRFYRLERKGRIALGADADLLVLDRGLSLEHLFARGAHAVVDGTPVLRGTFSNPALQ
jgi:beta-aspartyl-dipeptidase (metallo-type)